MTVAAFFLNTLTSDSVRTPDLADKSHVELVGKICNKEIKKNFSGDDISVIYLIPTGLENRDFEMVQCYMEPSLNDVPSIGEYVKVSGQVKLFHRPTNPGEFDSYLYYSTLKISYRLNDAGLLKVGGKKDVYKEGLYRVRIFLEQVLDRIMDEKDAGVMKAMLLGDKAFIDEETKDMYKSSGIMHILAVSALHVSIIGMGIYELLKKLLLMLSGKFGRLRIRTGALITIPAVFSILFMYSYAVMCGMGTSAFRAIAMFAVRLIAPLIGRTYDILSSLSLAAILLLIDQPLYLYNSGFLFSFGAVLGIAVVKPCLRPLSLWAYKSRMEFSDDRQKEPLRVWSKDIFLKVADGLMTGLAIGIVTLPVYAKFYYIYPLHSLILNLMVIPLMTVLLFSGIISMLLGAVAPVLGILPGMAVHVILAFYRSISSVEAVNSRFTWYMGHSDNIKVSVYLALLVAFTAFSNYLMSGERDKKSSAGLLNKHGKAVDATRAIMLIGAVIILTFRTDPDFSADLIDVGQGDAILLGCGDQHMLIDGGSTSKKNVGKYQIIPFLKYKGIGRLDAVLLTHEDQDHMSGILEIMDDMEKGGIGIDRLILPDISASSKGENYEMLEKRAFDLNIPVLYISSGDTFSLSDASFICLNPTEKMVTEEANAYSTVLFMKYGDFTALFTGDMEKEGLDNVKAQIRSLKESGREEMPKSISLLKVAHHGSMYTTDEEFLKLTNPGIALISCGKDNSYGHPHDELLDRLNESGTKVYRTDMGGAISVTVENNKVYMSQFLKR